MGFSFDLCARNQGSAPLSATKTGTTIAGLIFKDGVILGADTRATSGPIVADKNCSKIHFIAPNIFCCGAGTAADTEAITRTTSSALRLQRLNASGRTSKVATCKQMLKQRLFQYEGHIGAALIVGGVDSALGAQLVSIHPHGSSDSLPYTTMGSGSLAAMAVFEARYRPGMEKEEAMALVADAIEAGIFNDLGSGSNVDLTVVWTDVKRPAEVLRNWRKPAVKLAMTGVHSVALGTTRVLREQVRDFRQWVSVLDSGRMEE